MEPFFDELKVHAIKLTTQGERHVKLGHPWVFSKNIQLLNEDARTGDKAIIFDKKKNKFLALGLVDLDSPIRIKVLQPRHQTKLDKAYFNGKLSEIYHKRDELFKVTNAFRWVFGENDGLPGIIIDVYNQVVVIKLYSRIWLPYLHFIIEVIPQIHTTEAIVLRLSRLVETEMATDKSLYNGAILYGDLTNEEVVFHENGVDFSANVIKGHKTGYFLDHRQNRIQVGQLSKGKRVMDIFSYAGGFSIHALVGGASKVVSVDISQPALDLANSNAKLNGDYHSNHELRQGDAFKIMDAAIAKAEQYDIVVIDPPSFAKRLSEVDTAKEQYKRLAEKGAKLVAPRGQLIVASCSSRVSQEEFLDIVENQLNSKFKLEQTTFHDIDHPIGFPEGAYLKCAYFEKK